MENFIKSIATKIGLRPAVDLNRDARLSVLEKILLKKQIVSDEELRKAKEQEEQMILGAIAQLPK